MSLWNSIRKLFNEAEASSPSQPAVHEMIERSEADRADYQRWYRTHGRRRLLDWLADQYAVYSVAPDDIDKSIDFLNTPSSKGFVMHFFRTEYTKEEVTHFFDYLKERVLQLNYRTQISDRRVFGRPQWVETQERHYLKPRNKADQPGRFIQAFGNITIELELRDDRVRNLRLRATVYQDHMFQAPESFRSLIGELVEPAE